MTTIDAAAARHTRSPYALLALFALLGAGLTGCGSGSSLFSNDGTTAAPQTSVAQPAPPVAKPQSRIALAPVIGAPDAVAKQLSTQLADAMAKQRVTVASAGDRADYTVRGYIVAAKEKAGTKVSYIWDVTDPSGKRVNRVTGEEVVAGAQNTKDPWSVVSPQLMQTIADRTATQIAGALPAPSEQSTASLQASASPQAGTGQASVPATASAQPAATRQQQQVAAAATQGGAGAGSNDIRMVMPSVNGAPGDGSQSLASALQRELSKNGVGVADRVTPTAYRVEGKVFVGQGREGRQPIHIDWIVKDGQGNRLGTVTQKNEVEQGTLDGAWGQTAEMAAAAAAQGILKLMQPGQKTATN